MLFQHGGFFFEALSKRPLLPNLCGYGHMENYKQLNYWKA